MRQYETSEKHGHGEIVQDPISLSRIRRTMARQKNGAPVVSLAGSLKPFRECAASVIPFRHWPTLPRFLPVSSSFWFHHVRHCNHSRTSYEWSNQQVTNCSNNQDFGYHTNNITNCSHDIGQSVRFQRFGPCQSSSRLPYTTTSTYDFTWEKYSWLWRVFEAGTQT